MRGVNHVCSRSHYRDAGRVQLELGANAVVIALQTKSHDEGSSHRMSGAFTALMIDEIADVGSHSSHTGRCRHDSMLFVQFCDDESPLPVAIECRALKPGT